MSMKIKTEFESPLDADKVLSFVELVLSEHERGETVEGFTSVLAKLFIKSGINEDEIEGIIRLLEHMNLLTRKFIPLEPRKLYLSVPDVPSLQNYAEELMKPIFDEQSGILQFKGRETKFKRNSKQWRLIKYLYDNPNMMRDYKDIAKEIGLINEADYRAWNSSSSFNKGFNTYKKKINNCISEIKQKLHLEENDASLLFCNNGYLMRK